MGIVVIGGGGGGGGTNPGRAEAKGSEVHAVDGHGPALAVFPNTPEGRKNAVRFAKIVANEAGLGSDDAEG